MAGDSNHRDHGQLPVAVNSPTGGLVLRLLQSVPEEEVWLAGQLSAHTRRAYKRDVAHFVRAMRIRSAEELRLVNRAAVVAWQNLMKEQAAKPRTIRRRLSALSSLFTHLVAHRMADTNPVRDINRPRVNRRQGTTRAFSAREARKILDAPNPATLLGLRDRADRDRPLFFTSRNAGSPITGVADVSGEVMSYE